MTKIRKSASNETMNFGEVILLMEASFNYHHAFSDGDYLTTQTDSIFIPVTYSNHDEVEFNEIRQLFIETNNTLLNTFAELQLENKKTIMFDLELQKTRTAYQIFIQMTSGSLITLKSSEPIALTAAIPFGNTDYWHAGVWDTRVRFGKCGDFEGQYFGVSDATLKQEKAARKYRRGNMKMHYFTDLETYPDLDDHTDLWRGWVWAHPRAGCIYPPNMNEYYRIIGQKIEYWYNFYNVSTSKQFANIDIHDTGWREDDPGYTSFYSYNTLNTLTFGIKREREEEESVPFALEAIN